MCDICKGSQYLTRNVPVGHLDFGTIYPCECFRPVLEKRRIEKALGDSALPPFLKSMTFANFDPGSAVPLVHPNSQDKSPEAGRIRDSIHALEAAPGGGLTAHVARIKSRCQEWAQNPQGTLVLLGLPGCGKTHLAAAIVNESLRRGDSAIFTSVPDLLDHLRSTFSPKSEITYDQRFEAYKCCSLLILDDLGTEAATAWADEKLYQLVNCRWNNRLPIVTTSNHLPCHLDARLQSRLFDTRQGTMLELLAGDYRLQRRRKAA